MRFFFYGTLIDADVRRLVLGRLAPDDVEPAILRGWRRVKLAGVTYPGIVSDAKGRVEGVLARGLGRMARRRLERYEGDEYALVPAAVAAANGKTVAAQMFVSGQALKRASGVWTIADWQRRHKRRFLASLARSGSPS